MLSRWELAWAVAAFAGFFPRNAHADLIGFEELDLTHEVAAPLQALVAVAPLKAVLGIRLAIVLCALAPFFLLKRLKTLAALDAEARTRVVGQLLASSLYPVRQLALLLKMIGSFLFARSIPVKSAMLRGFQIPSAASSGPRLVDERALVRRPALVGDEPVGTAVGVHDARRIA
jgi:hypothetical protein